MDNSNSVLVLKEIGGKFTLQIEQIENGNIPEFLNGESGFHVYHVRMLTELILNQLVKVSEKYPLTPEAVSAISVASSLHDIGKLRIPKSILDFPGKLSPVEYDIVKKHAVFGEEIIAGADGDISSEIIAYAKEIARSHHERFDGTGYPDALQGDEIPVSAQVVALADSFDALTSARSYKKAFSQDVAIEMISNGMCGSFDPILVECLLQVVNNKVLLDIRESLLKKRSVIYGKDIFTPKRVLLVGNTGYITDEFIDETFYNSSIIIIGDSSVKKSRRVKVYNRKEVSHSAIFDTYEFDIIIYFAKELTYNSFGQSDAEDLREILNCVQKTQKGSRFLYLSSLDAAFEGKSDRAMLANSKEMLCEYFAGEYSLDIKIVRIPYLFLGTYKGDFLYSIFSRAEKGKVITLDEKEASKSYFLSVTDLAQLIVRLTDNWKPGTGILTVNDEFNITFSDISAKIFSLKEGTRFDFSGENPGNYLGTNNKALRNEYGWFSRISILEDMEEQYENYLSSINHELVTLTDKIMDWLKKHSFIVKLAELFALFIITEILLHMSGSSVVFSLVDFRMAYIVIMGTIHGLPFGMASAGLSSLSWLVAKVSSGTNLLTIFYEPTNWFAFVLYFLIGALCGYVRLRSDNKVNDLKEQNELLEDKLIFTRELYNDTFNEKRTLKKQIIGSKDSFGKIFDITRQLDTVEPRKLYLRIMDTFEEVLENKSISVYSVNENSSFARLEVASRDIMGQVSRSISLDAFAPVVEKLKKNEVWRNTELAPGFPMYAAEASRGKKLELIIFIWHCESEQRTLYYVNLFKILCDLVEMSLLRAYDYNQAAHSQQYLPGTRILNCEEFEKTYENFKNMADRKVFSYIHMEVDCGGRPLDEIDDDIEKLIRTNDILGLTRDGKLRILFAQASKNDLAFILPRFDEAGINITLLEN